MIRIEGLAKTYASGLQALKSVSLEIRRSAVDLICKSCGAKLRVPAATEDDLDDLCCHMRLTIPGRS